MMVRGQRGRHRWIESTHAKVEAHAAKIEAHAAKIEAALGAGNLPRAARLFDAKFVWRVALLAQMSPRCADCISVVADFADERRALLSHIATETVGEGVAGYQRALKSVAWDAAFNALWASAGVEAAWDDAGTAVENAIEAIAEAEYAAMIERYIEDAVEDAVNDYIAECEADDPRIEKLAYLEARATPLDKLAYL